MTTTTAQISAGRGFHIDEDAALVVLGDDTWLGDILEDNGAEPDGPAWIIFPIDDAARAEIARLGIAGDDVDGFIVEGYTVDGQIWREYDQAWMGNQKAGRAFFVDRADAERCVAALHEAQDEGLPAADAPAEVSVSSEDEVHAWLAAHGGALDGAEWDCAAVQNTGDARRDAAFMYRVPLSDGAVVDFYNWDGAADAIRAATFGWE